VRSIVDSAVRPKVHYRSNASTNSCLRKWPSRRQCDWHLRCRPYRGAPCAILINFRIPAGTSVSINPLFTHYMPELWPELYKLGVETGHANSSDGVMTGIAATAALPATIHSSIINASATTGGVAIFAGATNTSGAGHFQNGGNLNANITITYPGLRSRVARALMLLRTTPRTVSSSMAAATGT